MKTNRLFKVLHSLNALLLFSSFVNGQSSFVKEFYMPGLNPCYVMIQDSSRNFVLAGNKDEQVTDTTAMLIWPWVHVCH